MTKKAKKEDGTFVPNSTFSQYEGALISLTTALYHPTDGATQEDIQAVARWAESVRRDWVLLSAVLDGHAAAFPDENDVVVRILTKKEADGLAAIVRKIASGDPSVVRQRKP